MRLRKPAVGDVGNIVGIVLDFPTNVADRPHADLNGLIQALSSGWHTAVVLDGHVDEPDVGIRLPLEGQELLTDAHGTRVHEADPRSSAAIEVRDSGVQCKEGCEGRHRRPAALRINSDG